MFTPRGASHAPRESAGVLAASRCARSWRKRRLDFKLRALVTPSMGGRAGGPGKRKRVGFGPPSPLLRCLAGGESNGLSVTWDPRGAGTRKRCSAAHGHKTPLIAEATSLSSSPALPLPEQSGTDGAPAVGRHALLFRLVCGRGEPTSPLHTQQPISTSDRARPPAEFKHITKRRKRN